jgi:two-component system nitrogen regulation response regulator GlnG/two-component system response regulator HydG
MDGPQPRVFGRGAPSTDDPAPRILLVRQGPGANEPAAIVENPFLSRVHLHIEHRGEGLFVEALGKRPLRMGGGETGSAAIGPGDLLEIKGLYSFLCVKRPLLMPPLELAGNHTFGGPDAHGFVGESVAAWKLRAEIAFCGARTAHVLITGASGTGKELVAQAIHASSPRARLKVVARNAATFPDGLIDAELFGNMAHYPNAGMPDRPGLIGQADGSTLFLDEIGELPHELQAHLLRVMDDGDYQRLGESRRRTANIRFVAATNRPVDQAKQDLLARFALRVRVPGFDERREDIPVLARHLLSRIALEDPQLGQRFFSQWNGRRGEPRLGPEFARALLLHRYQTHARELEALIWRSLSTSQGAFLDLTDEVRELLQEDPPTSPPRDPKEVTAEELRSALARHGGAKDRVWRELGLQSRHVLRRLIEKHRLDGASDPGK